MYIPPNQAVVIKGKENINHMFDEKLKYYDHYKMIKLTRKIYQKIIQQYLSKGN